MTEYLIPLKNRFVRKVQVYYIECMDYKSLYGLKFFDKDDNLMLEVGKFD
jgi:hypothetical protein